MKTSSKFFATIATIATLATFVAMPAAAADLKVAAFAPPGEAVMFQLRGEVGNPSSFRGLVPGVKAAKNGWAIAKVAEAKLAGVAEVCAVRPAVSLEKFFCGPKRTQADSQGFVAVIDTDPELRAAMGN